MAKFEERPRFELPNDADIDRRILGMDYKGDLITREYLDATYYYIVSEDDYVKVKDFKEYILDALRDDVGLADYITEVMEDIMLKDSEMELIRVIDIEEWN